MVKETIGMSVLEITPIHHPLNATVRVPGSKSLTNRALLIAALARGTTHLSNMLFSDDSRYFAQALRMLGFDLQADESHSEMTITGLGGSFPVKQAELFIGNAGTAARFITAFLTLGEGEYILDGDSRMRERPIEDLVFALRQLGATLETPSGRPPLKIIASGLRGGRTTLPGDVSSQFLSALLMVSPYARQAVEINVSTELNSKPYVEMTLAMMREFGAQIEREREGYERFVIQPAFYQPKEDYVIEPDATAASYFFAAPAICGGKVRVQKISRRSKQGDFAFLDALQEMGCSVVEGASFIEVIGSSSLCGLDIDLRDMPDTAQTLAVIAPFASTPTQIRGIASARLKETDRIRAICTELTRLGIRVEEYSDGMTIHPCERVHPAVVQTYSDHRMAMAFSLIGLHTRGITIENPTCVSKTFPDFFKVLESLR
jgi:3-phosphoshikimate 1-carboxyvinyltransferase